MKMEKMEIPEVEISCLDCNSTFKAQIGELHEAQPLICPNCHREIIGDGSFRGFLDATEKNS
jgi:Zn finger protein HypA/HybF involved in hydrogenase expression